MWHVCVPFSTPGPKFWTLRMTESSMTEPHGIVCITREPGGSCLYHERTRWHTVCVPFSVPGVGEVHKEDKLQQQEHKASRHANVHPVWNRPALPYTNYHHAHNGNKTLTITLKQSSKAHNSVIPGLLKIKCVLHMYTVQFMYYITQCIAIQCIA